MADSSRGPGPASFLTQANALFRKNLTFQVFSAIHSFSFSLRFYWGVVISLVHTRLIIFCFLLLPSF